MAESVFNFGMHTGKTFQHVFDNDKWYVAWAFKQDSAGSIKCKTGLLKRFVDYCKAASSDVNTSAGSLPATPWSQQATQAEHPKPPSRSMAGGPMMVPTPMMGHAMVPQAAPAPYMPPTKEAEKGPQSDPTWCQVLDHLEERGIDFETVRDAHHDTRRDILKAVFYGDPILRAQAETMWLKLRQEKQERERQRSRSRGRKKLNFTPCTISCGVAPSFSAGF